MPVIKPRLLIQEVDGAPSGRFGTLKMPNASLTDNGDGSVTYAASGSSAYTRTATKVVAASNAQDTTNADYVCDGTADQTEINTAIGALPAAGGRIILSDGLFTVSATILINQSNVVIEGQGEGTVIALANSTTADCITYGDATNVRSGLVIRNLAINGNLANQTVGGHGILVTRKAARYLIDNVHIYNTYRANIRDRNASTDPDVYGIIRGCYLDTTKSGAGWCNIEGIGNNVIIENNFCIGADVAAIDVYNAGRQVTITGNTCKNTSSNSNGTIAIEGADYCVVSNNTILDSYKYGVYLEAVLYSSVEGNVFTIPNNISVAVIYGDSGSFLNAITGNAITVTSATTAAVTGIKLDGGYNNLANNVLEFDSSFAHIGIHIAGAGQMNIGENILHTNQTSGTVGIKATTSQFSNICGVFFDGWDISIDLSGGSCSGMSITNCSIINPLAKAIDVSGGDDISIVNCHFDTPTLGIVSTTDDYTNNITITGNTFSSTGEEAIIVRSGRYWTITGNTFAGCGSTSVIWLRTVSGTNYSVYNVISGNTFRATSASYNIREDSTNDGPNVITNNIALGASTAQISTQHASTDVSHNITA